MKISIFSDLHFGFASNTPLEEDSFYNAEQALKQSLDCDLILICGDIFDEKFPKPDEVAKAIKIFSLAKNHKGSKVIKGINKEVPEIKGIPIIALHGTHERWSGHINAVQLLESAGSLIHLHKNGLIVESGDVKVAIQGMSGVPERHAAEIMEMWSPKPIEGCYNILLLHQSIHPFIYSPIETPSLNLDNLPEGFDLIVDGHIHKKRLEKIGSKRILLTGSTIVTQLKEEEQDEKGVHKLFLPEDKIIFDPLQNVRKFFFEEIEIKNNESAREKIINTLNKYKGDYSKKPLIKLKIVCNKFLNIDKEMKSIVNEYDDFIIKYSKEVLSEEPSEKVHILREARERKFSIVELGMKILEENLAENGFSKEINHSKLFDYAAEGRLDQAKKLLMGDEDDKGDNI
jgi:DNA repair exonuclease SbcCD nuclease subunit